MAFVKLADNYTDLIGKFAVALLAEGVDRNIPGGVHLLQLLQSPSSRGAWIEITSTQRASSFTVSRPPRGGRG